MGDHHVGTQARLMSKALRKLTGSIARTKCTVVFINQLRMKIGVMFGNPETTTGGNALKFYCSVRLDIRRIAAIKQADEVIGNRTRVKVVKNKVAAPFRQAEFDIMFGEGISFIGDLLDLATAKNIVVKAGAWFSYGDERLGQGRENAKIFLKENKTILDEIEVKVKDAYGIGEKTEEAASSEERVGATAAATGTDGKPAPKAKATPKARAASAAK